MARNYSIALLLALFFLTSCEDNKPTQVHVIQGNALGTTYTIKYYGNEDAERINANIDIILTSINNSMSTWQDDSIISKLNDGRKEIEVDQPFVDNLELSQKINHRTDGYFDPTVAILVDAYGIHDKDGMRELDRVVVDTLMQYVGLNKITYDKGKVIKGFPEMVLDFNAIAKGYTLDEIAGLLDRSGYNDYLIELGGEIVAKGTNLDNNAPWKVGVEAPEATAQRSVVTAVALEDKAMATSGNYRKNKRDENGKIVMGHIVNPKTGSATPGTVITASVLGPDCATADAYATAFMVMPLELTQGLVEQDPDLSAYLIYIENGETKTYISPGFQEAMDAATLVSALEE